MERRALVLSPGLAIGPGMCADARYLITLAATICLVALPSQAAAQAGVPTPETRQSQPGLVLRDSLSRFNFDGLPLNVRESMQGTPQPAQDARRRDSLANGIIIGAVVGAAAFGGFGAILCKAYQEPQGPGCISDTLRFVAIGAAIGAGGGLALDAALTRQSGVRVSLAVRF